MRLIFVISYGCLLIGFHGKGSKLYLRTTIYSICSFRWFFYGADWFLPLTLNIGHTNDDNLVKSQKTPFFVIPAKAGIQCFQKLMTDLDPGFRRVDDFLRSRQPLIPDRQ